MTITEIRAAKSALRKKYKKIRNEAVSVGKNELDRALTQNILTSMSYKYCKTILVFASYGDEPDTWKIAEKALSDGKRVFFPRCYNGGIMKFFKVNSLEELSSDSMFGIHEPSESAEEYVPEGTAELCLVPGLCFDGKGYRIGYGKGFYDRFLAHFEGIAAGVTYSACISSENLVFEKRYDKSVDIIFSEKGVDIIAGKKKI